MTSPEEYNVTENQERIKERLISMTPKNLERLMRMMIRHLEGCTFTPEQFWEANHMINQIDYVLDGHEIKKGKDNEVRSNNTRTTGDRQDNNSSEDS